MKKHVLLSVIILVLAGCAKSPDTINIDPADTALPLGTVQSVTVTPTIQPLQYDANCQLPCWWDITPGTTSWPIAEEILQHHGSASYQKNIEDDSKLHAFKLPEYSSDNDIIFIEKAGMVEAILIDGYAYNDQTEFETLWGDFAPKQIMKYYGVPSRVWLSATGVTGIGNTGNNGYILWIFYDQLGLMIRYDGVVKDLPIYHFCPELRIGANNIDRLQITMQSLTGILPLERYDGILSTEPDRAFSIEKAANISIEDFYNLFIQENGTACFDSPHNIWPK